MFIIILRRKVLKHWLCRKKYSGTGSSGASLVILILFIYMLFISMLSISTDMKMMLSIAWHSYGYMKRQELGHTYTPTPAELPVVL
jgi:hypothetical protein